MIEEVLSLFGIKVEDTMFSFKTRIWAKIGETDVFIKLYECDHPISSHQLFRIGEMIRRIHAQIPNATNIEFLGDMIIVETEDSSVEAFIDDDGMTFLIETVREVPNLANDLVYALCETTLPTIGKTNLGEITEVKVYWDGRSEVEIMLSKNPAIYITTVPHVTESGIIDVKAIWEDIREFIKDVASQDLKHFVSTIGCENIEKVSFFLHYPKDHGFCIDLKWKNASESMFEFMYQPQICVTWTAGTMDITWRVYREHMKVLHALISMIEDVLTPKASVAFSIARRTRDLEYFEFDGTGLTIRSKFVNIYLHDISDAWVLRSDLYRNLRKAFPEEQIVVEKLCDDFEVEIAVPSRKIHVYATTSAPSIITATFPNEEGIIAKMEDVIGIKIPRTDSPIVSGYSIFYSPSYEVTEVRYCHDLGDYNTICSASIDELNSAISIVKTIRELFCKEHGEPEIFTWYDRIVEFHGKDTIMLAINPFKKKIVEDTEISKKVVDELKKMGFTYDTKEGG